MKARMPGDVCRKGTTNVSGLGGLPPFEVLDLRSFPARMTEEVRPAVAEDAAEKLE
jgi:hypothetical protein